LSKVKGLRITKTAISKDTFGHSRESGNPEKTLDSGSSPE